MICDRCGIERDLEHVCHDALKAEVSRLRLEIENIVTQWKAEKDAMVLQNRDLTEALKKETEALERSVAREDATFRLNEVLQNRMKEIAKVASKPGSQFPKAMAAMNEVEGKIAIVACELSGDLSYIKGLAESPIIENRFCECSPMTYQENAATGNCVKCGLPMKMKRNDDVAVYPREKC